jgi:hypothetical protein
MPFSFQRKAYHKLSIDCNLVSDPENLTAKEPKNPRPALLDNGEPREKPRLYAHTNAGHDGDKKPLLPL